MKAFYVHVRKHSEEGLEGAPRECPVCHEQFENKFQLQKHDYLSHKKGYTKCPKCPMILKEAALQAHDDKVHGDFFCDVCGTKFK